MYHTDDLKPANGSEGAAAVGVLDFFPSMDNGLCFEYFVRLDLVHLPRTHGFHFGGAIVVFGTRVWTLLTAKASIYLSEATSHCAAVGSLMASSWVVGAVTTFSLFERCKNWELEI